MDSISLITDLEGLLPSFKEKIQKVFPSSVITDQPDLTGFAVHIKGSDRLYVDYYGTSSDAVIGWTENELVLIGQHFPEGFHLYSIHYRSIETIKKIITQAASFRNILVDNEFGTFLTANEFVSKMTQNPCWDWRNDIF